MRALPGETVRRLGSLRERLLASWAGYSFGQRASTLALALAVLASVTVAIVGGGGSDDGDLVVARDSAGNANTTVYAVDTSAPATPGGADAASTGSPILPIAPTTAGAPQPGEVPALVLGQSITAPDRTKASKTSVTTTTTKKSTKGKPSSNDLRNWILTVASNSGLKIPVTAYVPITVPQPPPTAPPTTKAPTTTARPPTTQRPTTTERPTTTLPPTTAPPVTLPPTTEPPTTAPPTTAPPTTAPPTTAPPTTAPPTTAPPTTEPPTTAPPFDPFLP
ncbi:MAG: hypothetical protein U0Q22_11790 [Acidimicrobiales bacterium]